MRRTSSARRESLAGQCLARTAQGIWQSKVLRPQVPFAYATTIDPADRSQADLRAHLGVPDVSAWVPFCGNRNRNWYPFGPPAPVDYWTAPAQVLAVAWGPNPRS